MKEIVVISGKGGTGKTSIVSSFAALADKPVLADCDVDAADLHLILEPKINHREDFSGGKQAKIIQDNCTSCGKCFELCRFNAIKKTNDSKAGKTVYTIDPIACEGCGVCVWFCPTKTINFEETINGEMFISDTRYGQMVHAKLGIAEENSGKLVTKVRKRAREIAEKNNSNFIIVDGSPGIGCAVIASITNSDIVVIVTEPTLSGKHDFERVASLTKQLKIPAVACINKYDLNSDMAEEIEDKAKSINIPVIGKIRYDKAVTKAQIMKSAVVEYTDSPISKEIKKMWREVIYAAG